MGQYKVPQNVEAEDKIIGPLTLKQFIYAVIGVAWAGLCFLLFNAISLVVVIAVAAPFTILFMLLAFYQRDGQNFEQYLVAIVGYFSQSRQRIWRKEEVIESFHIEPKKATTEQNQRNPLEVRSQLEQLANIVDARGWAEDPDESAVGLPSDHKLAPVEEDRIIRPVIASPNKTLAEPEADDVLDLQRSPLAQNLNNLLQQASTDVRKEAVAAMKQPVQSVVPKSSTAAAKRDPQPVMPVTPVTPVQAAPTPAVGPALIPGGEAIPIAPSISVTQQPANGIIKLATESDDLTVSQLAAQATRVGTLPEGQSVSLSNGATTNPVPKPSK